MSHTVRGPFTVSLTPQPPSDDGVPQLVIDKQFEGPLTGRSAGRMMSCRGSAEGSAAYVAIERVEGTLDGRTGAFSLVHFGLMRRGAPSLSVEIVPDSGEGELTGIAGSMDILIDSGAHSYVLTYTL